jgi:hypothetical protein
MKSTQQPVRQKTNPAPLRQGPVPLDPAQLRHVVGGVGQSVLAPRGSWI